MAFLSWIDFLEKNYNSLTFTLFGIVMAATHNTKEVVATVTLTNSIKAVSYTHLTLPTKRIV